MPRWSSRQAVARSPGRAVGRPRKPRPGRPRGAPGGSSSPTPAARRGPAAVQRSHASSTSSPPSRVLAGRPPASLRRRHPVGQAPRGQQEAGVPDHPVLRPDGQTLQVPAADHRLPGARLGEPAVLAQSPRPPGRAGSRWRRSRSGRRRAPAPGPPRPGSPTVRACRGRRGRRRCRPERSARSPTVSCQAGCGPPKNVSTFARAMSAKSARRSNECTSPWSPTARSRDMVSAPEPTPASTTRAPGKMSAIATICPASLG